MPSERDKTKRQCRPWQFSLRMFLLVSVYVSVLGGMLGPPLASYIRLLSSQTKSSPLPKATPTWTVTNGTDWRRGSIGFTLTEAIQVGLIEVKPISGSNKNNGYTESVNPLQSETEFRVFLQSLAKEVLQSLAKED